MSDSMASRTKSSSSMTEILIAFDNSKGPNGKRRLVKTLRNPGLVLIRQKFDFRSHWRATRVAAALGSLRSLPMSALGPKADIAACPGKNFLTDEADGPCGRVLDQGSRRAAHLLRLPRRAPAISGGAGLETPSRSVTPLFKSV